MVDVTAIEAGHASRELRVKVLTALGFEAKLHARWGVAMRSRGERWCSAPHFDDWNHSLLVLDDMLRGVLVSAARDASGKWQVDLRHVGSGVVYSGNSRYIGYALWAAVCRLRGVV